VIGTQQDEITTYLYAVRAALGDLPAATRDELLDDLPEHLAEVLAEAGGTLIERLGPPEEYAAELRGSIGFVGGFPDPPPPPDRVAEFRAALLRNLRSADVRFGPVLGHERASEFFVLLRPAWWVLRGYLVAMVLANLLDASDEPMGLLPRIGGSDLVALALIAGGVLGSIWFGRRAFPLGYWPRYALYAASTVLVLVAIGGFANVDSSSRGSSYSNANYTESNPYSSVQDVFVYDQQGRLVPGARIFDQDGAPLELGTPECFDDETGNYQHTQNMGYPYCPSKAPFAAPSDERSPSAAPSAVTSATPGPTPSTSRSASR
jgi:hypothetical protein